MTRISVPFLVALLTLALVGGGCARRAVIPGRPGYVTPVRHPVAMAEASSSRTIPTPNESAPPELPPRRDPSVWRSAAEPWLGTPYRLGGTSRNGIDCSAFARVLHLEVSHRSLPRTTSVQWRSSSPVNVNQLQAGDLLFFETSGNGVSHVGVYLEGDQFVHASTSRGVTYSSTSDAYWSKAFLGARRP